jgi:hypothetical protein
MQRLGFGDAFERLPERGDSDELCYFSLDLSSARKARIKLYVAHHRATLDRIEHAVSTASGRVPGRAAAFCTAMAGGPGPYRARPVLTCLSFVAGSTQPSVATVHVPVRSYAASDGLVRARLTDHLSPEASSIHAQVLDAFARRPLGERSGMQTYASLRLDGSNERLTVYLAPEAYSTPVDGSLRSATKRPPRPALERAS